MFSFRFLKMKIIGGASLVALLLGAPLAFAGNEGHGGNGVVCRNADGSIKNIELLDFYEARTLRQVDLDLNFGSQGYKAIVAKKLTQLKRLAPQRAELYQGWFSQFDSESLILPAVNFESIPDSKHIFMPEGCKVEQLAVNRQPELSTDKRYIINGDLWKWLDETNKAGLILHEMIYREMASLGETTSISSRYFNSLLFSKNFASLSQEAFVKILHDIGIPTAEWRGWIFDLKAAAPCFADECSPQSAVLYKTQSYQPAGSSFLLSVEGPIKFNQAGNVQEVLTLNNNEQNCFDIKGNGFCVAPGKKLQFQDNGMVGAYWMYPNERATYQSAAYELRPTNTPGESTPVLLKLDEKGEILACERCSGYVIMGKDKIFVRPYSESSVEDDEFQRMIYPSVNFSAPGHLYEVILAKPHVFQAQGKAVLFAADWVQFGEKGEVEVGTLASKTAFRVQGKDILFQKRIVLGRNRLEVGTLAQAVTLRDQYNKLNSYVSGTQLEFDHNGIVLSAVKPH